ncbi:MAG: lysylphosphatidylglycerol synthase transmembrane domain-containing protein [Phascolarctobacterium sp.]|uniref:lysylphosphatidylglycerol synthase transmembrane domain-containing protein n=1 Tax=Phascolarctobacterium sp. TaxID=2049039 RepID=UPI0026DA732D|nr:lysylphosphatidylglycerol synthase transmembrane domain-containing protein [Phascolarctobacterium sp.]MDO4921216.1 lysylphosphatidylglycerol synthase transmembrane domain-containing protein [Phascolarctobacterium sp.]
MNKKLLLRLTVLFAFVLLISAAVIYFTFDIRALDYLTLFEPRCILLALGCLAVGLLFDGLRLLTLASITDGQLTLKQVVNVVLSNYFLALVTPGASGGAIAQVMFMRKAGVPVAKSTVVVLVRTIMSISFLILLVPVVLHSDSDIVKWMPASVLTVVSVAFISLPVIAVLLMRSRYPERIIFWFTRKFSYTTRRNCYIWYQQFKHAVIVMGRHPLMVLRAFVESGLSLLFIYATVPAYFAGLNINFDLVQVMGRMVLLNLVLYFSPTPGGSGIAEAGFVVLFSNILPEGVEGIMAVLWRFTAEYLPFLLGAFVTIRAFGSDVLNMASVKSKTKPGKNAPSQ